MEKFPKIELNGQKPIVKAFHKAHANLLLESAPKGDAFARLSILHPYADWEAGPKSVI